MKRENPIHEAINLCKTTAMIELNEKNTTGKINPVVSRLPPLKSKSKLKGKEKKSLFNKLFGF